jgi:serine/threonine-protein kinase
MTAPRNDESIFPPSGDPRDLDLRGLFVDDHRDSSRSSVGARRDRRPARPARAQTPPTQRDSPRALRAAPPLAAAPERRPPSPEEQPSQARARAHRREPGLLSRGAILDKYRIEALLGTGGFAAVYRATHLLLRLPVAIKLLRPRVLATHPGIAGQLLEEARYAARIKHPNVVRIHDVTHTEEITYIVMELIEGSSLAKQIDTSGPLAPERVVSIAIDVAEGLRAGLDEGLIHRDIKPANILVPTSGPARIVDFGLAHAASLDGGEPSDSGSGQLVGTRGYMAPEQARHPRRVDFRADVYALGVTLFQALTGVGPYGPRSDAEPWKRVPSALAPIVRRMMAPCPGDRPTSYDALLASLRQAEAALLRR